jgi:hypothetical protein
MLRITLFATLALTAATARADVSIDDDNRKVTVDCAKDKNVIINSNKVTATLTGTCDRVYIAGNKATVKGSAVQILVAGNDNTLTLDAVDELMVSGNDNTVTYKKGIKQKSPKVGNPGNGNKVSQTK